MKRNFHRMGQQPGRSKRILRDVLRQVAEQGNLESAVGRLVKRGVIGKAARLAVEKQFAQGVPAVWMENGIIYRVFPDGRKVKLAQKKAPATKISQQRFYIQK